MLADPIDPQRGALVIAPPSVRGVIAALGEHSVGFASGWMQLRRRRQSMDRGFVFSDHADWPGLLRAIAANGAERVIVNQIVRSPGVYFKDEQDKNGRKTFNASVIPNRGAWLKFETDAKLTKFCDMLELEHQ